MPEPTLVFFDASVLVAASHSSSGGSSVAIEVCRGIRYRAAFTTLVLHETRTNLAKKFPERDLLRFYEMLALTDPKIVPGASVDLLDRCEPRTGRKDAHVLAAALECGAEYLLTLDRRHLLTARVLSAGLPVDVMTSGTFLSRIIGPAT